MKENTNFKRLLTIAIVTIMCMATFAVLPTISADSVSGSAGTNKYYLKSGSSWEGDLQMDGAYTWEIIITDIDGSSVSGNKVYQTFVQESVGWNNFPIQVHQTYADGSVCLLQSYDSGWVLKSSHGFNMGAVIGPFDLQYIFTQNSDDTWHVTPQYRVPASSLGIPGDGSVGTTDVWHTFYDGAWDTANTFDFIEGLVGIQNEAGGGGTLNFDPPLVHCVDTDVWYVAPPSPTQPSNSIQHAIDYVDPGDMICAYNGAYYPSATINVNKPLSLLGPQAGVDPRPFIGTTTRTPGDTSTEAIIDGNGIFRIIYIDADNVIIDGLEVLDGTGDLIRQSNSYSGTTIRNCIVHDAIDDEGIQLASCTNGLIEKNYVYDVAQDGINFADSYNCKISENEITTSDSENGAIFVYDSISITIDSNYIHDTTSNNGIKLYTNEGDIMVKNNLIVNNNWEIKSKHHEYSGNGILGYKPTATGSTVTIVHNTISDNNVGSASPYHYNEVGFGNGIGLNTVYPPYYNLYFDGVIDIYDNIIAFNGLPSYGWGVITKTYYSCPGPSNCIVDYNDIYNNGAGICSGTCTVGSYNINLDPQYMGIGDYHLQSTSPCIDSGIIISGITVDIEGNPRDANPDMGAYEFQLPPVANANGPYLVAVGQTITLDGSNSSDPGGNQLTFSWKQAENLGTFNDSTFTNPEYTGNQAGITDLTLTVNNGNLEDSDTTIIVVYDPDGGFVTGGGWITSPPGAYMPDLTLTGKANFGFVSKYKKGQQTPTGNTEFNFKVADLNFHSDTYDWLVITGGNKAMYKGTGTINNTGSYKFMLTAHDDNPDTFRIKIWEEDLNGDEIIIYDNGTDTVLGGGQIKIHKN